MPIAATASEQTLRRTSMLNSFIVATMPSPSLVARIIAASSASPEERAIVGWVFDHHLRTWDPQRITPPLVDFLVFRHPAWSESPSTTSSLLDSPYRNVLVTLGLPIRYLPSFFRA